MSLCMSIFVGRAVREPELRHTANSNMPVATFTLAVDTGYGDKKRSSFFNIKAFGKPAESISKYVKKGSKLILRCEPCTETWTNREGKKYTKDFHYVQSWEFAEAKYKAEQSQSQEQEVDMPTGDQPWANVPDGYGDEVPFV